MNRFGPEPLLSSSIQIGSINAVVGIKKGDVVYTKINGIKIYKYPDINSDVLLVTPKGREFIYAGETLKNFINVFDSNVNGWVEAISVNKLF